MASRPAGAPEVAGSVVAVDLGATSGRVVLANVGDDHIDLVEVHRFPTAAAPGDDGLRLDAAAVFDQIQKGIGRALEAADGEVSSVGIDSWAVDYGLVGGNGLLEPPFNYRDGRTARGVAHVRERIGFDELYSRVGIQDTPFNTVNQLADDLAAGRLASHPRFLLLPDLFGYWLTGRAVAERTNASTTALLDPFTRDWNWPVIDAVGLPRSICPDLVDPGEVVGTITVGPASGIPLVAVGSHDTASAVVASPLMSEGDVFLSSGTWSLIGSELDEPVLTSFARDANFTNEAGVDGTTRFLKNVMGLWLISESMRSWERAGYAPDLNSLLEAAASVTSAPRFDATDVSLLSPGDMPRRIAALADGSPRLADPAILTRSILDSLADSYAGAVTDLGIATGRRADRIIIVGGGCRNTLLCQLTADRTGLPVAAGPVEATAMGNALIQARTAGIVSGTLADLRRIVMASTTIATYLPRPEADLTEVTTLSNEFGADPAFVRAGGGNSSVKSDGVLWIKPSGVPMAGLVADDLVALDQHSLLTSLDAPDPDPALGDPVHQIATAARLIDGPRRPSVEILFHALIPERFVLHTHPLLINAITCNRDGEAITRRLFGDTVAWVPYVDPGLKLAREIRASRVAFTARTGQEPPRATFLMNHGLIVSGDSAAEVRELSYAVLGRIERELASTSPMAGHAEAFRVAAGAAFVAFDDGSLARLVPTTSAGVRFLAAGPLIPDQIVYAGSFPLILGPGDDVKAALAAHLADRGIEPTVTVVPGVGVAAIGDSPAQARTAVEMYLDALTVVEAASRLGAVRVLDDRERGFIETWEAEAYRRQVSP